MRKTLAVLLIALIAFAAFASGASEAPTTTNYDDIQEVQVGTGNVDFSGKTKYKKDIVIGVDSMLVTLDPYGTNSAAAADYDMPCFDRLINLNETEGTFEPELATSWSWIDLQTLECKLRNDVKWTDGTQFTAADVKYTYEYARDNATSMSSQLATLESVEIVDDYTVRFHLTQPNLDFLNVVSYFGMVILQNGAYEKEEGYRVTTGAWIVKEFVAGDHYTLTRNMNYWAQIPVTETITLKYYPEASARLIALQNGEIDICLRILEDEAAIAEADPNVQLTTIAANTCIYFAFNTSSGAGSDQNFRLALAHCLNKEEIILAACNGAGTPAVTNWGKGTYGHYEGFGDYGQDYAKAAEYLAKTNYRDIDVIVRVSKARDLNALLVIQEQARKAGINIIVDPVEAATLSSMTKYDNPTHEAVVFSYGWAMNGDDARQPYTASNVNKANIHNDRLVELINAAAAETDDTARKALYAEVQTINHEQAYYLPLFYSVIYQGIRNGVTGVIWGSGVNDFTYACAAL
jgi:peptide/nickel transport system substrate-binding protein